MVAVIPGITALSDKRYKQLLDETLIKSKIIIDYLDELMRLAMGDDKDKANIAFMKLGNIVNSIQVIEK